MGALVVCFVDVYDVELDGGTLVVRVDNRDGSFLGICGRLEPEGITITRLEEGLIQRWNERTRSHSDRCVAVGHRIVAVNDHVDTQDMSRELRLRGMLEIIVCRACPRQTSERANRRR